MKFENTTAYDQEVVKDELKTIIDPFFKMNYDKQLSKTYGILFKKERKGGRSI